MFVLRNSSGPGATLRFVWGAEVITVDVRSIPYIWSTLLRPQVRFVDLERSDKTGNLTAVVSRQLLEHFVWRACEVDTRRELEDQDWPSEYWDRVCELANDYYAEV